MWHEAHESDPPHGTVVGWHVTLLQYPTLLETVYAAEEPTPVNWTFRNPFAWRVGTVLRIERPVAYPVSLVVPAWHTPQP